MKTTKELELAALWLNSVNGHSAIVNIVRGHKTNAYQSRCLDLIASINGGQALIDAKVAKHREYLASRSNQISVKI